MNTAAPYDPFESDWRACLEAHLRYVISMGDKINEVSLIDVLKASGFTDEDIRRVRHDVTGDEIAVKPDEPTITETPPAEVVEAPVTEVSPVDVATPAEVVIAQAAPPSVAEMLEPPAAELVAVEVPPVEALPTRVDPPAASVEELPAEAVIALADPAPDASTVEELPAQPQPQAAQENADEPPPTQLSLF